MPLVRMPGMRPVHMGERAVTMTVDPNGVRRLRSPLPLPPYPRSAIDWLDHWAAEAPDRVFLADRCGDAGDGWRSVTFAQARAKSRALAQALIDRGVTTERPLVILSGNAIEHGLLALAAMTAGVAFAPVSPAYSLVSSDFSKLRHIFDLLTPGMVYAADKERFGPALAAVAGGLEVVTDADFEALARTEVSGAVDAANAAVTGDTVAKFLFTSGSTGLPKAVINTQRMITCNQAMIASALAFLKDEPPVLVDWLPWNHTAGGNHNFGIALANGGTLWIDDGNPTPAGIARTVRNLEEVAPTLYFNVPKGYEMLAERLATNGRLRETFFSRVQLLQYAGAGLAQHVWDALERLAMETIGEKVMIITGYGSTETAPFASTTTWPVGRPGEVGLPAPGLELKLVPDGEKLELRLKGPSITPGYWRQPDKTAECFDDEGFYRIGDALKFVDEDAPEKGLLFDGRVSEDFKLSTGTWVNMAAVRGALVRACAPYVRDAVLTGLDRNHIGAMLVLDLDAARKAAPNLGGADEATLAASPELRRVLQERLDALAAGSTGSSTLVARAVVLDSAPSLDRNEVTDKGSINQRAVMAARPHLVEDLYAEPPPTHVLVADATGKGRA
ncbi:MAG: feruloyl-CoA synthase [Rhizobiaceae bacterium]|nr:feruloyl-CoA synthase [Rhizobiaceae bacterium]MCV0406974.1 feruloyl-CoA synthase [Rhizobiaceae bacterium]